MINKKTMVVLMALFYSLCSGALPLSKLKLPAGFKISIYAHAPGARELALGAQGVVFVGSHQGKVYALIPNKQFNKAEKVKIIASGLTRPNGVAVHNGNLYVAETARILLFKNIMQHLNKPVKPIVIKDNLPDKSHHGLRYIKFGPDDWLYMGIGAPCNACLRKDPRFATIVRMQPDGSNMKIFAHGVRNSVGFAWNPNTQQLWFTDNGRDWMGDQLPPDKLNYAPYPGMHFGFPYVYGNNVPAPKFGKLRNPSSFTPPTLALPAHVAALGMTFYSGKMFPAKYRQQIFIAEHGSWNRSKKIGYQVIWVQLDGNKVVAWHPFVSGWLQGQTSWGRPVDVLVMPDGAMLISDDLAGVVYRVSVNKRSF